MTVERPAPLGGITPILVTPYDHHDRPAFEEVALASFAVEMARRVRSAFPEAVASLDEDALLASMERRLAQALSHGITERADVRRYLECSYLLGWTDDGPDADARGVLSRDELTTEEKVDAIERRTEFL